jgi:cytochrome c-type biogenesis protein CcmE
VTPKHKRRLWAVLLILAGVGVAVALALTAFQENLMYFYSPSQIAAGEAPKNRAFRVGGLVTKGSVQRIGDGMTVEFTLTDLKEAIPVSYTGILPDLFREGQGIVALGRLDGQRFRADEVLAKHDENYMPPEVSDALKDAQATLTRP